MAKILHRGHNNDGLMRGEGKFEILQKDEELWRQLTNIEKAGRICYRSERKKINHETSEKFTRKIMKRGHHSVIEHSCLTVVFSNISRGFTHEMVRHRLCGFSQESTRYVDYDGGKLDLEAAEMAFVMPPHIDWKRSIAPDIAMGFEGKYKALRKSGWIPQDARQFLPIGIASKIAVTANFREWRHIMAMRTQKVAHWEIRYIMVDLLTRLKQIIPVIFEDFYRPLRFEKQEGGKLRSFPGEFQTDDHGYGFYLQYKKWPDEKMLEGDLPKRLGCGMAGEIKEEKRKVLGVDPSDFPVYGE